MKIIITAANGFIGQTLVKYFSEKHEVIALARQIPAEKAAGVNYQLWDGASLGDWTFELEGADAVINLAGRSVNCRYNEKNKRNIYQSRLESTEVIGKAIEQCADKPKVWINAASATIYKHSLHEPMTEKNGTIGEGFSVDVCQRWEQKFADYKQEGVRQVVLRTAIVLGKHGGVIKPFNRLAAFGLGGKMAGGKQMFSWIHEKDLCRAIDFLVARESCEGVYKLSAPNPVTNEAFMQALRKEKKVLFGIPSPAWLLKLGAKVIGTETELIFKSRFVVPERLLAAGFEFEFENIGDCLRDLNRQPFAGKSVEDVSFAGESTAEDLDIHCERLWIKTSTYGSLFLAFLAGVCVLPSGSGAVLIFFLVFMLSLVFSAIASAPVLIFAKIKFKAERKHNELWAMVWKFQLLLFTVFLIGGLFYIWKNSNYEYDGGMLAYAGTLVLYLLTGFAVWRQGILKR